MPKSEEVSFVPNESEHFNALIILFPRSLIEESKEEAPPIFELYFHFQNALIYLGPDQLVKLTKGEENRVIIFQKHAYFIVSYNERGFLILIV
jgi:hypothetical protein